MEKIKKILYNPWTITVGSGVIIDILLRVINKILGTNFPPLIFSFMMFKIPIWTFLLCLGVIFVIRRFGIKKNANPPEFTKYKKDIFEGTLYKWEYIYDEKNDKYEIGKIKAYCADCKFLIVNGECQNCRKMLVEHKSRDQIEAFIRFNIQKKFSVDEFRVLK